MDVRLDPADEYMHELEEDSTFNESMYFNFYDIEADLGGFVRLGNRANEGYAEATTCLYLPGGRVAFMYGRPEITGNDAFDAGGMTFEVVEPFEELKVAYDGKVVLLDDPLAMADPRKAFTENPYDDCRIELTYRKVSEMVGGEPTEQHERSGEEFARGHYEQLVAAAGTIGVGETGWKVQGFGLRDHSWGPRTWQAPWYYRWLTANFGSEFGFMGSRIARRDRDGIRGGFVWDGDELHLAHDFRISTEWTAGAGYHQRIAATLVTKDGDREREWNVIGEVMNLIPLRNRRDGMVTRISEGMTRWTLEDGRVGYGLSEYLDQIIDEQPVGIDE
ncbi:MAG: hypothetical protein JJLCMIEE_01343 [Acidimicrobiales bacterium]|nr:MAG: hypothetical protein EDR02_17245 [Actinomycetota bacterium]MBV6508283.1 hypothetical protein [Acidimicrobiales bacterium]RIK07069.1 MAG: hypothetical protein DCC48_04555 [Acidobacteriota bacterium]